MAILISVVISIVISFLIMVSALNYLGEKFLDFLYDAIRRSDKNTFELVSGVYDHINQMFGVKKEVG